MPFTPTHLAAAIPFAWLCRWRVPLTALAIGTMVSDIPVYFPALMSYASTHSTVGVLTHCLPIGLLLYYVYHGLMKRPLVELLPAPVRNRLFAHIDREIDFDPKRVAIVSLLIVLGAVTHVFWDSFTHAGRWGTVQFPWLNEIAIDGLISLRWYSVFQHASSVVLLPPMLVGFGWWLMRQPSLPADDECARLPLGIAWSVIGLIAIGGFIHWRMIIAARPHYFFLTTIRVAVAHAGAVFLAVVLLYCVGMQLLWMSDRRAEPDRGTGANWLEST